MLNTQYDHKLTCRINDFVVLLAFVFGLRERISTFIDESRSNHNNCSCLLECLIEKLMFVVICCWLLFVAQYKYKNIAFVISVTPFDS